MPCAHYDGLLRLGFFDDTARDGTLRFSMLFDGFRFKKGFDGIEKAEIVELISCLRAQRARLCLMTFADGSARRFRLQHSRRRLHAGARYSLHYDAREIALWPGFGGIMRFHAAAISFGRAAASNGAPRNARNARPCHSLR